MSKVEQRLSSPRFWLRCGVFNHSVACLVVLGGCIYSGLSCQGEVMKSLLSAYTFTIFTPQVAFEVIILLALFLVKGTLRSLIENWALSFLFIATFLMPILLIS